MGLNNNDIMKKLRVAHKLKNTDIVEIIALGGLEVSVSRLDALFRNEDHPKFVLCGDQILRNFLDGLIIKMRGPRGAEPKSHGRKSSDKDMSPASIASRIKRKPK